MKRLLFKFSFLLLFIQQGTFAVCTCAKVAKKYTYVKTVTSLNAIKDASEFKARVRKQQIKFLDKKFFGVLEKEIYFMCMKESNKSTKHSVKIRAATPIIKKTLLVRKNLFLNSLSVQEVALIYQYIRLDLLKSCSDSKNKNQIYKEIAKIEKNTQFQKILAKVQSAIRSFSSELIINLKKDKESAKVLTKSDIEAIPRLTEMFIYMVFRGGKIFGMFPI